MRVTREVWHRGGSTQNFSYFVPCTGQLFTDALCMARLILVALIILSTHMWGVLKKEIYPRGPFLAAGFGGWMGKVRGQEKNSCLAYIFGFPMKF